MKYPYIADPQLYAAVKCACRMIRETGYFNKACQYAADEYGFNFEDIAKEVRKRQAAGQKGSKFYYFTCCRGLFYSWDTSNDFISKKFVKRAKCKENIIEPFRSHVEGGILDLYKVFKQYNTKKEAEENLENDFKEYAEKHTY